VCRDGELALPSERFRRPAPELEDSELATPNSAGNYWPNNADDLVRAGIDPEMRCLALVLVQTYSPDPDRIRFQQFARAGVRFVLPQDDAADVSGA
jgi:hypothetical protein